MPKKPPKTIEHYSKQQVDFLNILYGYISRHPECHLENLTIEKPEERILCYVLQAFLFIFR